LDDPQIEQHLHSLGIGKSDPIICDTSNSSGIGYLQRKGWNAIPANKPAGSKKMGINSLRSFEIYITRDSVNWKQEQESYKYKRKRGVWTNEPIDGEDHLWDSLLYWYHHWYPPNKPKKKSGRRRARAIQK